ncbi:MAG TPA: 1-phosphofructokinase family hexose kinase [Rhodanobacteraceae bacterium]|nr:1-phosphofructokinase family hexose kinase [Rhodanobacteraceae bacterium]
MITVVGPNTAIDRSIDVGALRPGEVQRATAVRVRPGGKGLHVAQTVAALGEPVRLVGLDDAAHATLLAAHLNARGVDWQPVRAPHALRQCLALHEADGRITEILETGDAVPDPVQQELIDRVASLLGSSSALVLSGSLPAGFPADTYATWVRAARARNVPCLVDASGGPLKLAVRAGPWLVKPNVDEAGTLAGRRVAGVDDALECARTLQRAGVICPVVTLGAAGAVSVEGDAAWRAWAEGVRLRNGVGSGDCFLAAMAVAAVRGESLEASLQLAVACGAANAENEETGFAERDQIHAWVPRVRLERLRPPSTLAAPAARSVARDA